MAYGYIVTISGNFMVTKSAKLLVLNNNFLLHHSGGRFILKADIKNQEAELLLSAKSGRFIKYILTSV